MYIQWVEMSFCQIFKLVLKNSILFKKKNEVKTKEHKG